MKNPRRDLLKAGAAGAVAAGALGLPLAALAQPKPVRIGVLHPVTGPLAYSGQQCREGALMAIEAINQAGGIKSLGGAKIEPVIGDAQSKPAVWARPRSRRCTRRGVGGDRRLRFGHLLCHHAGRCQVRPAARGGHRRCRRHHGRGLKNTFRFGPGYKTCSEIAVQNLHILNTVSGKPAKTVMIIHEESLFGTGTANLLKEQLPQLG